MNDTILTQILAHAARAFPREACGLLLRDGGGVRVLECDNRAADPERSFLIDPAVYAVHAHRIEAVYHSHPNRDPAPSAADIASAERCAVRFVIVSYPSGQVAQYTPTGLPPAPYEGRAFVYGVMDCLSLVADWYRFERGIVLNDGERKTWGWWDDPANANAFINGFLAQGFARVDSPQPGDVVIMQLRGACPQHAAIYLGDNRILHHASPDAPSRVEMYGQFWRHKTVNFLRYGAPECRT
ncbi:C40 family peptidase [Methylomonas sp. MED-D]|uniref:C40 family peptidase n=1 Tax=Methylomonas sp. MED-D TaxID=3418768 RepID=UPI003D071479